MAPTTRTRIAHAGAAAALLPALLLMPGVAAGQTASRSRNIPYVGRTLRGRVRHTVFQGEAVVVDGEAQR